MRSVRRIGAALGILWLLACAPGPASNPAEPGRTFVPSGFLGNYEGLRPGKGSGARLGYIDSAADFSGYDHVIIEPVVVWSSDESRFSGVPRAQRERLAGEWEAELRRAMPGEFRVVDGTPGPGTLRVRSALTGAIAAAKSPAPGRLQYLEVELELLDASTSQRIAAAVDSKGSAEPSRTGAQPVDAGEAFRDWAERLSIRVAALRSLDRR